MRQVRYDIQHSTYNQTPRTKIDVRLNSIAPEMRARLASIFGIPEVEFEFGFTMPRFVLGGNDRLWLNGVAGCRIFTCMLDLACKTLQPCMFYVLLQL